jgi:hypothetical protein
MQISVDLQATEIHFLLIICGSTCRGDEDPVYLPPYLMPQVEEAILTWELPFLRHWGKARTLVGACSFQSLGLCVPLVVYIHIPSHIYVTLKIWIL